MSNFAKYISFFHFHYNKFTFLMKKIILILMAACLQQAALQTATAQVLLDQNFNTVATFGKPAGWTTKNINNYSGRGVANSNAMQYTCGATSGFDTLETPLFTQPVPAGCKLSFAYRFASYVGSTPFSTTIPAGSKLIVKIANSAGIYTTVKTITTPNPTTAFITETIDLAAFVGQTVRLDFRINNAGGSGTDYFVHLDDILIAAPVATENRGTATAESFKIFPNPSSNGSFAIRLVSQNLENATVRISDVAGKTIAQSTENLVAAQPNTIFLPTNIAKGVYLVQISSEELATPLTQKLIVE